MEKKPFPLFVAIIVIIFSLIIPSVFAQDNDTLPGLDSVEILDKAIELFSLGEYEEAIIYFDKALEIEPDNVDALKDKALILYLYLDKYEEAIIVYDKILAIEPDNVDALKDKARAQKILDRVERGLTFESLIAGIATAVAVGVAIYFLMRKKVDSIKIPQEIKCRKCQAVNSVTVKVCKKCGKRIRAKPSPNKQLKSAIGFIALGLGLFIVYVPMMLVDIKYFKDIYELVFFIGPIGALILFIAGIISIVKLYKNLAQRKPT